jgi:hypothetical protein
MKQTRWRWNSRDGWSEVPSPKVVKKEAKVLLWFVRRHLERSKKDDARARDYREIDKDADIYVHTVFTIHEFYTKHPEFDTLEEVKQYVGDES